MWPRASATTQLSSTYQPSDPSPTPISSAAVLAPVSVAPAVVVAAKTAAHDAIVSGLDAVAAKAVGEGAPRRRDLLVALTAETHAERRVKRPQPEHDEHARADEAEDQLERADLEQRRGARDAGGRVEHVDEAHGGGHREARDDRPAQHGADEQQRDRPDLGGDERPEPEAEHQRRAQAVTSPFGRCPTRGPIASPIAISAESGRIITVNSSTSPSSRTCR